MNNILPPRPPEGLDTDINEQVKPELVKIEEPKVKPEQKKGFLTRLFKHKEKPENESTDLNEELPVFEIGESQPKEFSKKTTNKADLDNIRNALGILPSDKKQSIQKEFEDHVEAEQKKSKSKELKKTAIVVKTKQKSTKPKVTKKTFIKKPELPKTTKKKTLVKVKKPSSTQSNNLQKPVSKLKELNTKLETTKNKMLEDAKLRKPNVIKAKQAINKELTLAKKDLNKYFIELKSAAKKETDILKSDAKKDLSALKNAESKFVSIEEKVLKQKKEVEKKEQYLISQTEKVNHQTALLEKFSKEIKSMDSNLKKTSQELAKKKEELANTKKMTLAIKKEFAEQKKKINAEKRKLDISTKEKLLKYQAVSTNLDNLNKKIETKQKAFAKEEEEIKNKRKGLQDMLAEQKKIYNFLKQHSKTQDENSEVSNVDQETTWTNGSSKQSLEDISFEDNLVGDINAKISDCDELVKEGKIDDAKMLYNEIRSEFVNGSVDKTDIAKVQLKIKELYEEICKASL